MIEIKEKKECCGCNACVQICPKGCISMSLDEEGFLYPQVDMEKCIQCGLCKSICPVQNVIKKNDEVRKCYVAYSKDNESRNNSSSGGIFSLLAEEVLNNDGVVFGASWDEDMNISHICIESLTDIELLRGSKYIQSKINDTYFRAKSYLDAEKMVLFTGTACQIAGLKKYLRREYNNLYTVDVLCHGVPSPKVWQLYLKWQEKKYGAKANKIFFRNKETGWKSYSVKILFENGKEYSNKFYDDLYMKFFLKDICLRPSCHDCKYKKLDRPSDITLGDSWGIQKIVSEMDDDKGTSIILVHSENGIKILEKIEGRMNIIEADVEAVLPSNADSRNSVKEHEKRTEFFYRLEKNDMNILAKFVNDSLVKKSKRYVKRIVNKMKRENR